MSQELQLALATYVVPALLTALLALRGRRLASAAHEAKLRAGTRQSDWEASKEFRDELRADNADLRRRVQALEGRVQILTELLVRHGVPLPAFADEEAS